MSGDSLFISIGKRHFCMVISLIYFGMSNVLITGQTNPNGDLTQQAAQAGEEAYKLIQANKLDEARLAYQKIVTDYQQPDYALWDTAITAMEHVATGDDEAASTVIEKIVQDFSENSFVPRR